MTRPEPGTMIDPETGNLSMNAISGACPLNTMGEIMRRFHAFPSLVEALEDSVRALDLLVRALTDSIHSTDTTEHYPGHATINAWEEACHLGIDASTATRTALASCGALKAAKGEKV